MVPVSSTFQVQDLAELGDVSTIHANRHGDVTGLVRIDDVLVLVRAGSGTAGIVVAGDAEPVPRVAAQLKERYQADLPTDDDTVPVCFRPLRHHSAPRGVSRLLCDAVKEPGS